MLALLLRPPPHRRIQPPCPCPARINIPKFPRQRTAAPTDGGAAYGTAKAGMGIGAMGVMHPQLVMRNIIPVVMAGVLGIYGLIVSVILLGSSELCTVLLFLLLPVRCGRCFFVSRSLRRRRMILP